MNFFFMEREKEDFLWLDEFPGKGMFLRYYLVILFLFTKKLC